MSRDEFVESDAMAPAELGVRLLGVADQPIDFGRPEITWIDLDQRLARAAIDTLFFGARALPGDGPPDMGEGLLDELAHRV